MKCAVHKQKSLAIVYDSGLADVPGVEFFNARAWESRRALVGEALGRGSAWFIDAPFGPAVLRQYFRGGWVAKISRERYFFTKVSRSRPFREFHLLAAMHKNGLPVPRPVAALCEHHGLVSTGALMTMRIEHTQPLADHLPGKPGSPELDASLWKSVGKCIYRFHKAGVWHADLNARNILLDENHGVFLIDFDRAKFTPGKTIDGKGNLNRLKRSLSKLWPADRQAVLSSAWEQLMAGYHA